MGTRHMTVAKKNGEIKLAQYGQWDGHPKEQGLKLLAILNEVGIEAVEVGVGKLVPFTMEEMEIIEKDTMWKDHYPQLSRDVGTNIIKMIAQDGVTKIFLDMSMLEPNCYIEFTYVLDFDKKILEVYYGVMNGNTPYATFELFNLPDSETFLEAFKSEDDESEEPTVETKTQEDVDNELLNFLADNPTICPQCNHKFSEEEHRYLISNAEDNQNCPKCKFLIT